MRIGIYTIHTPHNFGAMLQAYALVEVLRENGEEVELINMYTVAEEAHNHHRTKGSFLHNIARSLYLFLHPDIKDMERHFDDFHQSLPLSKRFRSADEYMNNPNHYDLHLVGSDQVWNLQKGYHFSEFYFLDYLPADSLKKSYAASFGTTKDLIGLDKAVDALSSFDILSIREDLASEMISKLTGKPCAHVVDPTLLLPKEKWLRLVNKEPMVKGDYILFYGVNSDANTWNIILEAKRQLRCKVVGYPGPLRPQYRFDRFVLNGGPKEFLNLVNNATAVITSSYHGLAFSIVFNKRFILLKNSKRAERMESLVRWLGVEEHIAEFPSEVNRILELSGSEVSTRLKNAREDSLNWIKRNITNM